MAIDSGYTLYRSDRTGEGEYLREGDPRIGNYPKIRRVTSDGVLSEYVLDRKSNEEYKRMASRWDAEFNAWMSNPTATGGDTQ